ncbi:unnamed protein product, partial [Polarella glacialis]
MSLGKVASDWKARYFEQTASCEFCGELDSVRHRAKDCKALESVRSRRRLATAHFDTASDLMTCHGLCEDTGTLDELRRRLQGIELKTVEMIPSSSKSRVPIFTDGTGNQARFPAWRLAAGSVARGGTGLLLTAFHVPGIAKTVPRSELYAGLLAIKMVHWIDLYTDHQRLFDGITAFSNGQGQELRASPYGNISRQMANEIEARPEGAVVAYKVKSHKAACEDDSARIKWMRKHNGLADRCAKDYNSKDRPEGFQSWYIREFEVVKKRQGLVGAIQRFLPDLSETALHLRAANKRRSVAAADAVGAGLRPLLTGVIDRFAEATFDLKIRLPDYAVLADKFLNGNTFANRLLDYLRRLRWADPGVGQGGRALSLLEILIDYHCATGTRLLVKHRFGQNKTDVAWLLPDLDARVGDSVITYQQELNSWDNCLNVTSTLFGQDVLPCLSDNVYTTLCSNGSVHFRCKGTRLQAKPVIQIFAKLKNGAFKEADLPVELDETAVLLINVRELRKASEPANRQIEVGQRRYRKQMKRAVFSYVTRRFLDRLPALVAGVCPELMARTNGVSGSRKVRQKGAVGGDEDSTDNGGWRRSLCWVCAAASALTWIALLFLTGHHFLERAEAEAPAPVSQGLGTNRAPEAASHHILKQKADLLESVVAGLRKELDDRDVKVVHLEGQLAAIRQPPPDTRRAPAMGGERPPQDAAPKVQQPPVAAFLRGGPPPLPGLGGRSPCDFRENVDYLTSGAEDLVQAQVTPEQCCQLCITKNELAPGSCTVSVLSSETDSPPRACWIKGGSSSDLRAVHKPGVRACWPPGHGLIPVNPPDPVKLVSEQEKRLQMLSASPGMGFVSVDLLRQRAVAIRGAIRHAWDGYRRLAWGMDELQPIAGRGKMNKFNHAVTMVDSLSTLWIAGLKEEFNEAKAWMAANMASKLRGISGSASVFETTIRTLGGLLSAYDLSRDYLEDKLFLDLSVQLGHKIVSVVSNAGVTPYTFSGGNGGMGCHSLAESGTIQLEMRYLSHVTGDPSFAERVDKFYALVRGKKSIDGLYSNCYDSGRGKITMGADGDSFYEYLIKAYVQGGQRDEALWGMYDQAVDGMEKHLVKKAEDLTYLGVLQWNGGDTGNYVAEMEHLTCFVPGWLALGANTSKGEQTRSHRMDLAKSI